ncbi:aspartate aminotransferase family protein [Pseudonocardia acaciae]|uniref:aspartate aminotransferase family protein n=1 Tax=Pseudonocardia acaciae TaxID=551276 RepID=UPI00146FD65A|nr:aminotransferase class III-fold pyridoxal phosphate-dependent enzyme [Pseudonocardia acaciae]
MSVTVADAYRQANPISERRFREQADLVPGGATHLARAFDPFPLFIDRCRGARKWDVDGHEYVDYWMGHGANLLGHGHPAVLEALAAQLPNGLHAGGETELGLEWARLVCELVPSAEQVRFMAAGGEATQMALRLARAHTGRNKIVKFTYNFHGWHDAVMVGYMPPFDVPYSVGLTPDVRDSVLVAPFNDLDATRRLVESSDNSDDIAGLILEPGGAHGDTVPSDPEFLAGLRRLTRERGIVLIFDEVVTGFRYARGGAQEYFGVTPDLTTLGKIVGGGVAAGAVAGGSRFMEPLVRGDDPEWARFRTVPHPGTWNANPLAAAAGVATLRLLKAEEPVARATDRAATLRDGINDAFERHSVPGMAYGRSSILNIFLGDPPGLLRGDSSHREEDGARLARGNGPLGALFRKAMLLEGVDLMGSRCFVSAAHSEADVEHTLRAVDASLERLKAERAM